MRARWSSYRFRRRFYWTTSVLGATAAVVVTAVMVGNTAKPEQQVRVVGPAQVYHAPKLAKLSPGERARLLRTSLRFVQTAVARRHLDEAYDLAGPTMRQGMSRREWLSGNIPVVPFPAAGVAQWTVAYSYVNDVAFQLSLLAKPGSLGTVVGKTFTIELTRPRSSARWRVASWFPTGISSVTNDIGIAAVARNPPPPPKAPLAVYWLALPLGVLALIVVIPVGLAIRSYLVSRKVEREYLAERGGL